MLPFVMGSLIEFENASGRVAFRMYITGDTLLFDQLKEIPGRFPDIDLALLHLGGTMFFNLMMVTMDPRQGVGVIKFVKPKKAIPIHYDDYTAFESALGDTGHPPERPARLVARDERHVVRGVYQDGEVRRAGHRCAYPPAGRDVHLRGPREPPLNGPGPPVGSTYSPVSFLGVESCPESSRGSESPTASWPVKRPTCFASTAPRCCSPTP